MNAYQTLSFKRWCDLVPLGEVLLRQNSYAEFEDHHCIPMKLPRFYDSDDSALHWLKNNEKTTFPFRHQYEIGNRNIANISNLKIVSDFFLMGSSDFLFEESYHCGSLCQRVLHSHPEFAQLNIKRKGPDKAESVMPLNVVITQGKPIRIQEPCIVIGSRCGQNYWHWVMEILPKLWVLDMLPELDRYRIILPFLTQRFQLESLQAVRIKTGRVIQVRPPLNLSIDRAIVPSFISPNGFSHTIQKWYKKFLDPEQKKNIRRRRLFITRKKSAKRKIVNEDEITHSLKRMDFDVLELDGMSFQDQVQLFANSEIVIATHGAGLTNVLFANRPFKIIEIIHDGIFSKYYWMLANALGYDYTFFQGRRIDNRWDQFNHDIFIEKSDFMSLVEKMIAN